MFQQHLELHTNNIIPRPNLIMTSIGNEKKRSSTEDDDYSNIDEEIKELQARKATMVRENAVKLPKEVGLVWLPDAKQHLPLSDPPIFR